MEDSGNRRVVIQDSGGYKYNVQLNSLIKNYKPNFVGKNNPFTLPNMSLWLERENKPFVLCEDNVYKGKGEKLFFRCLRESCQEIFDISWNKVFSGKSNCPFCSGNRVGKRNNLKYLRPDLVKEWDYSRNEKNPENYTCGRNSKVWWVCSECGHNWKTFIYSRVSGNGCPKCNQSKGEKKIISWLEKNWKKLKNIGFINAPVPQKTFLNCKNKKLLPFDFGLENIDKSWLLIEYHGEQHFFPIEFFGGKKGFKNRQKRDKIKEKYCKDNNIPLLTISYNDYDNIENFLEDYFFPPKNLYRERK